MNQELINELVQVRTAITAAKDLAELDGMIVNRIAELKASVQS